MGGSYPPWPAPKQFRLRKRGAPAKSQREKRWNGSRRPIHTLHSTHPLPPSPAKMNKNWNDRADKDLFFTILSVKNIGVISGAEWTTIGNHMRTLGYGFTNEGCRYVELEACGPTVRARLGPPPGSGLPYGSVAGAGAGLPALVVVGDASAVLAYKYRLMLEEADRIW